MSFSPLLARALRYPTVDKYTTDIVDRGECSSALDVGCGGASILSAYRGAMRTIGVDAFPPAISEARTQNTHDVLLTADVTETESGQLLEPNGGHPVDLVTLFHIVEHLPKARGYTLLERCEELSAKYIIVATPNGFLPQGPEYGNQWQRHLSGWFRRDFEGLGYTVFGSDGTRYLRGYAGLPRVRFRGWGTADVLLSWLLNIGRRPQHAFCLVAIKDVRGVPARL